MGQGARILLFGCKSPFEHVTAEETLRRGLLRGNSGNLLFSHSAFKALWTVHADLQVGDLADLTGRPGWVEENVDHVVLPLANAFRPDFRDRLDALSTLVERLRIPVTVLGVGAQSTIDCSLEPLRPIDDSVRRFVSTVLDHAPNIGVRGEFTAGYLRSLGFRDVEVIGCPSMFLDGEHLAVDRPSDLGPDSRLVVTASPEDEPVMGPLLTRTARQHPATTYIAQGIADLDVMLWGDRPGRRVPGRDVEGVPVHLDHPLYRDDRVRFYVDASTWIDDLRAADFCFGTRIHGAVAALLAGRPGHVIAHDSRTLELARYFEIPHTPVDSLPEEPTAAQLFERSDYEPTVAGHPQRFARFVDYLESHRLAHSYGDDGAAERWSTRMTETRLAPPVRVLTALDHLELADRLRYVRREQIRQDARLGARLSTLRGRLDSLEQRTTALEQSAPVVGRSRRRSHSLLRREVRRLLGRR